MPDIRISTPAGGFVSITGAASNQVEELLTAAVSAYEDLAALDPPESDEDEPEPAPEVRLRSGERAVPPVG